MKRLSFFLIAMTLGMAAMADIPFKMIVRLWPAHHTDSLTSVQLLEALHKYPHFCDEVWFCTNESHPYCDLESHHSSARQMGIMADAMRDLGIIPSIQAITVGHPETAATPDEPCIQWGTMVGANGAVSRTQSCPRQPAFLKMIEEISAIYAHEVQPHGYWLDDDLRLTQHYPAAEICYCDDCIAAFNARYGYTFDRSALVEALGEDSGKALLRSRWVRFCQEGLAMVAAAAARGVHSVSPDTHMGLQHVNFHRFLLEGYDWNPIFDAYRTETGLSPLSRPGHGFYNDHAPRGMLEKGLDLARQIRRLDNDITEIAPEIEGYFHKATGKSPGGVCAETMYYLSMGATQMSYALICSGQEPMQWYADNYFRALQDLHAFAERYAHFNEGTQPGGVDPYISPNLYRRQQSPSSGALGWAYTTAGTQVYALAPLGIPFCPDGDWSSVLMLDADGTNGLFTEELDSLLRCRSIVVDEASWEILEQRGLTATFRNGQNLPKGTRGYTTSSGTRVAVVSYDADINGSERNALLTAIDWASGNTLPALIETVTQAAIIPRIEANGSLRSVGILNCAISNLNDVTLRLRPGDTDRHSYVWRVNGKRDVRLRPHYENDDVILTIPELPAWQFGYVAVKYSVFTYRR